MAKKATKAIDKAISSGEIKDNGERNQGVVTGLITDGDIRRAMERWQAKFFDKTVSDIMTRKPKTIHENTLAVDALQMMKDHHITNIFVVDDEEKYLGVIHIHDIIKEGIF